MRIGAGLVFLALVGLLTVLWRKELAMKTQSARATSCSAEVGMNELMRRLLWLPEQASTFAPRVDHLHYFVITVTMIVVVADRPAGVLLLLQVPRAPRRASRRRSSSRACSSRSSSSACRCSSSCSGSCIGFKDFIWYTTPPKDAMDVYVMGKKWMWKFAYPDGPNGVERAARAGGPPGAAADDLARRHPLLLRPRLPHQAGRAARPLHRDLVRGDQARAATRSLRRVLRHLALADARRGRGACRRRSSTSWLIEQKRGRCAARVDARRRRRRRVPRLAWSSRASRSPLAQGCLKCHSLDGAPHIGPTWLDLYHAQRDARERRRPSIADEAYLTESMIDPRGEDREGLQAGDADLPGAARGAGGRRAGRVHQVAAQRRASRTVPSKEAGL